METEFDRHLERINYRFDRFEERMDARFDSLQQSIIVTLASILVAYAALVAATIF